MAATTGAVATNASLILQSDIAGFLFGLGLNGLLTNLAVFNVHEYLSKGLYVFDKQFSFCVLCFISRFGSIILIFGLLIGDNMTSIAILLGITASKAESRDPAVFKVIMSHLSFLLPPTLLELNIDAQVQNAAVLGLGLLYARSSNYRLAEGLLRQLRQPASSNTDHMVDRESYALSCGMSLGLILLGNLFLFICYN